MAGILDIFANNEEARRKYRESFAGIKDTQPAETKINSNEWVKKIPVSMFYRLEGTAYAVGALRLDLILSESHSLTSTISEHPVESGAVLTDHIQKSLRVGKLRGLVTNHSIAIPGLSANRALNSWLTCKGIWERGELVTIVTTLEVYEDVAISSFNTDRDDNTGDALVFDISFQQVRRPILKEVTISAVVQPPDMTTDTRRKTAGKVNAGRSPGIPVGLSTEGATTVVRPL